MYFLKSICFVCLTDTDKSLKKVLLDDTADEIFTIVKYALPELTILNPGHSVYICSSCHTTLRSYSEFKKKCLDNYSRLTDYIKMLQGSNTTSDQSSSELQIRVINCDHLIKHENSINLIIEKKKDALMSCEEQHHQEIEYINIKEEPLAYQQFFKSELISDDEQDGASSVLNEDINALDEKTVIEDYHVDKDELVADVVFVSKLNLPEENEDPLPPSEEQVDCNIVVQNKIDVEEESLAYKDSADRELAQQLVCTRSESGSDDEQDGGSSVTSEVSNVLDKDEANSNTDTDSQEFQCSVCKEVFTDKSKFYNHLKNHLKTLSDAKCLICNKKLSTKRNLSEHMKYHLGIRDYECSICKKKFFRNTRLRVHMKMHRGIKDHECAICKKKFTQKCDVNRHLKLHKGIKDHECLVCKRKFIQRIQLQVHMKMHEDIKDYECLICNKKFLKNHRLNRHMKRH